MHISSVVSRDIIIGTNITNSIRKEPAAEKKICEYKHLRYHLSSFNLQIQSSLLESSPDYKLSGSKTIIQLQNKQLIWQTMVMQPRKQEKIQ